MKRIVIISGLLLALFAIGYAVYGRFLVVARPYRAEITETFEKTNNVFRIRVNQHAEGGGGFVRGAYYDFQCSDVGSNHWHEIMTFRHDDPVEIPRDQIRFVNDQIGYVFMGWMYALTTDGGRTWSVWNVLQDLPKWNCCNYRLVEDVEISSDGGGRMKISTIPGRQGEVPVLYTQDYGRHWNGTGKAAQ